MGMSKSRETRLENEMIIPTTNMLLKAFSASIGKTNQKAPPPIAYNRPELLRPNTLRRMLILVIIPEGAASIDNYVEGHVFKLLSRFVRVDFRGKTRVLAMSI